MDPVASSTGPGVVGERSGGGRLVIVVGGGALGRAVGVAMAPPAGQVLVVVLGAWPARVANGGPVSAGLVDGLGVAGDGEAWAVGRAGGDAVPATPHRLDGARPCAGMAAQPRYARYQRKSDREYPVVRLTLR